MNIWRILRWPLINQLFKKMGMTKIDEQSLSLILGLKVNPGPSGPSGTSSY